MANNSTERTLGSFLFSSLGKKYLMGLTGMYFVTFLLIHLAGNLTLLLGAQAFNEYGEAMANNPVIRVASIVGFLLILAHVVDGLLLTISNKRKRPVRYAVSAGNANSTFSSRMMGPLGGLLLIFLIGHLKGLWAVFKFGIDGLPTVRYGDIVMPNRYIVVESLFEQPLAVVFYCVMMLVMALHLKHGFYSMFQSLGLNHPKYTPLIKKAAIGYAILIPLGFASIPVAMFLGLCQ